ncbi:MAG: FAD-binding protein [Streptosporangiaceae bacterium]|nr:FAD-binding protein [Streptosporangiaceae bacterium]MBV9856597.1 FAD-binding protein [Streptosporangiaceae bacterium]
MAATNWAGNVTFRAARVRRPATAAELRQLVAESPRLHAVGAGHSFSPAADSPGELVSAEGLPPAAQTGRGGVRVSAGMTYGQLAPRLDRQGFALPNLASLPHITVAGACATGTHGSGDGNGSLATAVSSLDMVTADGGLVTLSRNEPGFAGAVVALGALGVVTSMTLDVVPAFRIRQWVYEDLPRRALDEGFDEIFSSAYSVSAFTTWRDPGRLSQVWVKHREDDGWEATPRWLGARLSARQLHPVPGMPPGQATQQLGVPGPWHERLPHFRADSTPSAGDELQSEYLLPRGAAVPALAALDPLAGRIAPVLRVAEIRTIAADGLWLSPCYQRDTVGFHFTWRKDTAAVTALLPAIEERLAPFAPRPHWGKLFTMPPVTYPRLADFRELMSRYDPAGKFRNAFIHHVA